MTKDDILDSYLLIPCRKDDANGKKVLYNHSLSGWFEVENRPLSMNTVFFIGNPKSLRNQLKRKEGIDFKNSKEKFDEMFKDECGITFSINRPDGSILVVIWMEKFEWSFLDMEILSHECLHASVMLMRLAGIKSKIFTADSDSEVDDEVLCYMQSSMFAELLMKLLAKQNRVFSKYIREKKRQPSKSCLSV